MNARHMRRQSQHDFNNIFSLLILPLPCLCANGFVNLTMFIIKNVYVKAYTAVHCTYKSTLSHTNTLLFSESREGNACNTAVTIERTSPNQLRFDNEISTILHN